MIQVRFVIDFNDDDKQAGRPTFWDALQGYSGTNYQTQLFGKTQQKLWCRHVGLSTTFQDVANQSGHVCDIERSIAIQITT